MDGNKAVIFKQTILEKVNEIVELCNFIQIFCVTNNIWHEIEADPRILEKRQPELGKIHIRLDISMKIDPEKKV